MTDQSTKPVDRLLALDGLRGIAILLVMWYHVWQISWLSNEFHFLGTTVNLDFIPIAGFVGVELFFFISGFCLYWPLTAPDSAGLTRAELPHYIYRRAIKILPSYWLAILLILICFGRKDMSPDASLSWHLLTHGLFIHNLWMETSRSLDGVFWSLGVEVQFYVLFPLIAGIFRRNPLVVWIGTLLLATGYRYGLAALHRNDLGFQVDQLPGFLDLFVSGMFAAICVRRNVLSSRAATALSPLALSGVLWLLYRFYVMRYDSGSFDTFVIRYRIFFCLDYVVLAVASCLAAKAWVRVVANPVLTFLSVISYNLYIWHQFLARLLSENRFPAAAGSDPHGDPVWQLRFTLMAVALSVAFASAITYLFERPLLRKGVRGCWQAIRAKAK